MDSKDFLNCIGYASGLAANNTGCALGPIILQESDVLAQHISKMKWVDMLYSNKSDSKLAAIPAIAEISNRLAQYTYDFTENHESFLILGGDHSSAIGTWSGAACALEKHGTLGLIWIDAHKDSHTPLTTTTGNIHGMPLAVLLGHGDAALTQVMNQHPKLRPEHVCVIGARDFEPPELDFLKKLNVRIFYMEEIKERGMDAVIQDALTLVKTNTAGFGISFDLDAIDPLEAPAVGVPAANGIHAQPFMESLKLVAHDEKLLGLEIVEFNPSLDQERKTEKLVGRIIDAIYPR